MSRQSAAGFTLIELVVVVLVIGIVAHVAIPPFMRNAEMRRTTEAQTSYTADAMYKGARAYLDAMGLPGGSVRVVYEAGFVDAATATAFGVDPGLAAETDTPAGGRAFGHLFTYQPSVIRKGFVIRAMPAAVHRTGTRSFYIDETGVILFDCPPGTQADPAAGTCEPPDNVLVAHGLRTIQKLDALSGGQAVPLARQAAGLIDPVAVLKLFDVNGNGRLELDEVVGADLPALIRKLHPSIGRVTGPGPAKRDVDAIVRGYVDAVRVDLAQGIAGAPPISVPLTDLKGDLAAFLDLVPPPGK